MNEKQLKIRQLLEEFEQLPADTQCRILLRKIKRWKSEVFKELASIYPLPEKGTYQVAKIRKDGREFLYLINVWYSGDYHQVRSKSLGRLEFHLSKEQFDEYHKLQRAFKSIVEAEKWLLRAYKSLIGIKVALREWRPAGEGKRGRPKKYLKTTKI